MRPTEARRQMERQLVFELPNDIRRIEDTVEFVVSRCIVCREVAHKLHLNLRVSLTEALSNAMIYGNRRDPAKRVRVEVYVRGRFGDRPGERRGARALIPTRCRIRRSRGNRSRSHGRGLFLMRELMDEVALQRFGQQCHPRASTSPRRTPNPTGRVHEPRRGSQDLHPRGGRPRSRRVFSGLLGRAPALGPWRIRAGTRTSTPSVPLQNGPRSRDACRNRGSDPAPAPGLILEIPGRAGRAARRRRFRRPPRDRPALGLLRGGPVLLRRDLRGAMRRSTSSTPSPRRSVPSSRSRKRPG